MAVDYIDCAEIGLAIVYGLDRDRLFEACDELGIDAHERDSIDDLRHMLMERLIARDELEGQVS